MTWEDLGHRRRRSRRPAMFIVHLVEGSVDIGVLEDLTRCLSLKVVVRPVHGASEIRLRPSFRFHSSTNSVSPSGVVIGVPWVLDPHHLALGHRLLCFSTIDQSGPTWLSVDTKSLDRCQSSASTAGRTARASFLLADAQGQDTTGFLSKPVSDIQTCNKIISVLYV